MKLTLSPTEQVLVSYVGKKRQENKVKGNVQDKRSFEYQDPEKINVDGFAAEFIVCKLLNCFPDFLIHNRAGGWDLVWEDRKIDVKFTNTNYLIAPKHKKVDACDLYVLVKGKFPHYEVIGFDYSHELIKDSNLSNKFGGQECYLIHKDELQPPHLLL